MKKNSVALICSAVGLALFTEAPAQSKLALTVYNQNLALVQEQRRLTMPAGRGDIEFADVAAQIVPESVQLRVLNEPGSVKILEQNFEFDLLNSEKLLQKYLGKRITFITKNSGTVPGKLLQAAGGSYVVQLGGDSLLAISRSEVLQTIFPSLPAGLRTKPTLIWRTDNRGSTHRDVEVSYLTRGIRWSADYVGVLDATEKHLAFSGWVSIENRSGAAFTETQLRLVAGTLNQPGRRPVLAKARQQEMVAEAAQANFAENDLFEYHLYKLRRPVMIRNNQKKQIAFIPLSRVSVEKLYIYDARRDAKYATVRLDFQNKAAGGPGMPLPAGTVRVYKKDNDTSQQFLGEDRIAHTPKDEKIRLTIGKAVDLIGARQIVQEQRLDKRSREQRFEIKLRNHKNKRVTVRVIERFAGDWRIHSSSVPVRRKTARLAEWDIAVPALGEAAFTFAVRFRW